MLEHVAALLAVTIVLLLVLVLRLRERISIEVGTLSLISLALAISAHVFPWYTTALLPWVAVLIGPLWTRKGVNGKGIAVAMAWYFPCTSLYGYFFNNVRDWSPYYHVVYDVVMVGLGMAATVGIVKLVIARR